jgi:hypothetical protein
VDWDGSTLYQCIIKVRFCQLSKCLKFLYLYFVICTGFGKDTGWGVSGTTLNKFLEDMSQELDRALQMFVYLRHEARVQHEQNEAMAALERRVIREKVAQAKEQEKQEKEKLAKEHAKAKVRGDPAANTHTDGEDNDAKSSDDDNDEHLVHHASSAAGESTDAAEEGHSRPPTGHGHGHGHHHHHKRPPSRDHTQSSTHSTHHSTDRHHSTSTSTSHQHHNRHGSTASSPSVPSASSSAPVTPVPPDTPVHTSRNH